MPLEAPRREPCPYCGIFEGWDSAFSGPAAIIAEDEQVVVWVNPPSLGGMEGHLLVSPRRHVEMIFDLTPEENVAIAHAVAAASRAVREVLDPDGLLVIQRNGVVAEQTVPHVHFHIIPRRSGTPFPPTEWVEHTPAQEREALAVRLRAAWHP